MKKYLKTIVIFLGLTVFVAGNKLWGYTVIEKVMLGKKVVSENGDTLVIEKDPATCTIRNVRGLKVDINKKYKVTFSQLDRMSEKKIDQLAKRFLRDYQEFIEVDLNELFLTKVHKDSAFRWSHTDSARWWKAYGISYSQVHRGVPVYHAKMGVNINENNKIRHFHANVYSNINISTTPSISKSQAVESAKRHLIENAVSLELPDSVRDYYDGFGFYWPEGVELSKLNALEEAKKRLRWFNKTSHPILEVSDTQKVYLNVSHPGGKTYLSIKTVKSVTPVTIYLKDSVKLFIFPEIKKDSSIRYSLRYLFSLTASSSGGWSYWVNAKTGEVIFRDKEWRNADFAIQGTI